jgi:predicted nicotinamide N-methyase
MAASLDKPSNVPPPKPSSPSPAVKPRGEPGPPPSTSAPGSRKASMFFNDHPRFYGTSQTSPGRGRLNLRYEAIFAENRDIFDGATVLDIASHDGRWSLAALECGARSVIGIEPKTDLVQNAVESLAHYGYGPDRATFIAGDVFDVFDKQDFDVDVVLCLGFLYHTLRYNELLHGIKAAKPRHVIIDTVARPMMKGKASIYVREERVSREGNAVNDAFSDGDAVLIGKPNLRAIRRMMGAYGFEVERLSDWGGLLRDNPDLGGIGDYARRNRITVRCAAKQGVAAGLSADGASRAASALNEASE